MENQFKTLYSIDVKEKIERKGNIEYLSWANAWTLMKLQFPNAQRTIYESEQTGLIYHTDGKTAWTKVGVKIGDVEHIDYLPVMDFRNNAIPVDKITSVDVNKTIQRSTAKAIAMHGLGITLWTGDDEPDMDTPRIKPQEQKEEKAAKAPKKINLKVGDANWVKVAKYVSTNKSAGLEQIIHQLGTKYSISEDVQQAINALIV